MSLVPQMYNSAIIRLLLLIFVAGKYLQLISIGETSDKINVEVSDGYWGIAGKLPLYYTRYFSKKQFKEGDIFQIQMAAKTADNSLDLVNICHVIHDSITS